MGRLNFLALLRQPVKEKENSDFKPVVFHLKIDLVSHPAHGGGIGRIHIQAIELSQSWFCLEGELRNFIGMVCEMGR